ncbi:hypothetical protein [Planctomicrobium piriforme]|uniref:Uncharacterized protein n=1 Tax=Planctomicrobium piriforme TaxID=1576369 RepID=A0A1I3EDJ7_9PLAN|nr:hypothetical protein [Planctomicrobium piriforme]SFH97052.1 hypothetical protein SAMN05421753_104177 [Planctomicrobium piriforme]
MSLATATPTAPAAPAPELAPVVANAPAPIVAAPSTPEPEGDLSSAFSDTFRSQSVAPVEPVAPTPAPQVPSQLYSQAVALGLTVNEQATAEEIAQQVMQEYQRLQPLAQYGQGLMPFAQEFQSYLQQRNAPQQQPAPATPPEWTPESYFREQWKAPQWQDQYTQVLQRGMVRADETTGLYVAAPGYEAAVAPILPGLNQAMDQQTTQWQQLMRSNPYQDFYEKLREPMQRAWTQDLEAAIEKRFQEREQQNTVQSFERENASWLYGQDGKSLSPQGEQFYNVVEELQQSGITDPQKLIAMGKKYAGITGQAPAAPAPVAAPVPTPQVPAPQPAPAPAPQPNSFLNNALQRAAHQPQGGANHVQSYDSPVVATSGELNSMFVSGFRATQGQPAV